GDDRETLLPDALEDPIDLGAMEEELAVAQRLVPPRGGALVGTDAQVVQVELVAAREDEGVREVGAPLAQRPHFAAHEDQARLPAIAEFVVVPRAPILGHELFAASLLRHGPPSSTLSMRRDRKSVV